MKLLDIGSGVYYTGDMANNDGHFKVIAHRNGIAHDLAEVGGDRLFRGVQHIAHEYHRHCGDRFVTESAWAAQRTARIAESERAIHRALYLAKQVTL